MKFVIVVAVFALVGAALYQKWRSIPPQTKQMWGALFGMAGAVRQAKKQMQEYGIVKKNVDSILYPSQSRAREQER